MILKQLGADATMDKHETVEDAVCDICLLHNEIGQSCKRNSPLLQ